MQALERFWAKVNCSDGCWDWASNRTPSGYGTFSLKGSTIYAHRFAYETEVGPIPEGLTIDHLCRNRGCVNPTHLEAVTHAENMRRGVLYGNVGRPNRSKTHCRRGHPFSPDNTHIYGRARHCRACDGRRVPLQ